MKPTLSLVVFLASFPMTIAASEPDARPSVILVVTDDQGYGDLRAHGNWIIRTPHLDRLRNESVRLTNFHVDPTCSPTRAALLTGRYSTRTGVWHTVMGRSLLHRDEVTMADVFREAGYRTAMIGKWHLGDNYPYRPQDRGFDETFHHGGGGIGQTPDHWGNTYHDAIFLRNGEPVQTRGYCTDVFFAEAVSFIAQTRSRPFFLYLATNVPHSPFTVDERYRAPYAAQGVPEPMDSFYGMIENMDENLGRLLARREELGLAENTIVIWATDNGTAAGVVTDENETEDSTDGSWRGFAAGMRGKKGSVYEGGHRVPCFIRWPAGGIEGGRDVDALTAHFDLLPTLSEWCDLPRRELAWDGRSLARLIRGESDSEPRTLFVHRQRREIPPKWVDSAVMTERWRLVNGRELYDIARDPGQTSDVAASHPSVVERLREDYETWWTSLAPALRRDTPLVIGASEANPTRLNAMDWHNENIRQIPWHQRQVAELPAANGYWVVEVARAGEYEFILRHQPSEAPRRLEATQAKVAVGDRTAEVKVVPSSTEVALRLELPTGIARLQTWLADSSKPEETRGAFFVEIRRID